MSERTDERSEDASVEDVLDDFGGDVGSGADDLEDGDVGLSDDELGVDVDALTGEPGSTSTSGGSSRSATESSSASKSGFLSRLTPSFPNPLATLPSGRSVLLTAVVVLVSLGLFSSIPLLSFVPMLWAAAIFTGAFALGAASGTGRYLELFAVGALFGAGSVMGDFFRIAVLADVGLLPLAAFGAGIGAFAGLVGHYFGRDFRAGLTRDIG